MDFYKTVFPINVMKTCIARMYVAIMKLLEEAIVYYRFWRLSKSAAARMNRIDG